MKICVYAISKNEEAFLERFYQSAQAADLIVLCDTGSTDNTLALADTLNIQTHTINIAPFRFDTARNAALALVPADVDVCISLDIDEVLMPGWREEIERIWRDKTTRLQYRYDWGRNHVFNATKVHKRTGYTWHYPCHEMIEPDPRTGDVWATTEFLLIKHLPDDAKSRGNYLPLLDMAVREDPYSARDRYYYARELWFHNQYEDSIREWTHYLSMPGATWYHERCYAQRILSQCYQAVGKHSESIKAARMAVNEAELIREPWVNLAEICQKQSKWHESFYAATQALSITHRDYAYTSEESVWSAKPYDLAALAAHYLGYKEQAREFGMEAWTRDMTDPRLQKNLEWYSK